MVAVEVELGDLDVGGAWRGMVRVNAWRDRGAELPGGRLSPLHETFL